MRELHEIVSSSPQAEQKPAAWSSGRTQTLVIALIAVTTAAVAVGLVLMNSR